MTEVYDCDLLCQTSLETVSDFWLFDVLTLEKATSVLTDVACSPAGRSCRRSSLVVQCSDLASIRFLECRGPMEIVRWVSDFL